MKFLVDFPMTIWATEVIEANSKEEAQAIADKLLDSWEFFCERLYPDYQGVDTHASWENCEEPIVQDGVDWEATMDEDVIEGFIG